ncbi:hypothetical protein [Streptomyces sp. NBC_00343]|uniref:hypothetical protein n=1 Tax=Streptomyces sp. NBC_00343 TaxID=2975719 RepID=UPI002E2C8D73|nr:hypothetical protein [Streptomyces sp. NBC_00343]
MVSLPAVSTRAPTPMITQPDGGAVKLSVSAVTAVTAVSVSVAVYVVEVVEPASSDCVNAGPGTAGSHEPPFQRWS